MYIIYILKLFKQILHEITSDDQLTQKNITE